MTGTLVLRNRQRICRVDLRLLRRIVKALLSVLPGPENCELGVYLVGSREITRLNETFLQHRGPTVVITFNYGEGAEGAPPNGEIFICLDEAVGQARQFGTSWQSELVRYTVHGILHLRGFDDTRASDRRKMKREEERLLGKLGREFDLRKLGLRTPARAPRMAR